MITPIIFLILFVVVSILGTVFAFAAFFMYTGRFGCDQTSVEMALPPAIMCLMCYAAAYVCLLLSGVEWML